ncbi:MAG: flagellar hook-length control protein FliK [Desulfobacterota bacterium]|nr:flagellar hook-length control protein FliK [Thermodesulfobacteriota bacterium]
MQTDFLSLIQLQPQKPSGIESSPLLGKSSGGDHGFEAMLKGLLGAPQESSVTVTSPPVSLPFQQVSQPQTANKELNPLDIKQVQSLLQKIIDALRQQKPPLTSEEANLLLQNVLTDEEHAYIKQFLQDAACRVPHLSQGYLKNNLSPEESAIAASLKEISALLSAITGAQSYTEENSTLPAIGDQNVLTDAMLNNDPEKSSQGVLLHFQPPDNESCNTVRLLAQLYNTLKQMSAAPVHAVQQNTPLQQLVTNMVPVPSHRQASPQQQMNVNVHNLLLQSGKSQPFLGMQTGRDLQPFLFEAADSESNLMQQLFVKSSKATSDIMQRYGNSGQDAPPAYTSPAANNSNSIPLALLVQQNGFLSRHHLQNQNLPENTADQNLIQWQILQKLVARTNPDAFMSDAGFSDTGGQSLHKHAQTSPLFDSTVLFKELIGSETLQHAGINTEPTGQGIKPSFAPHINTAYIIEQLLDRINAAARHAGQKISLQLFPPELGKIHIDLALRDNQLRAVVIAESQQVKQMLVAGIEQLKSGLEQQNIQLDRLSVMVAGEHSQSFERFATHLRDQSGRDKKQNSLTEGAIQLDPQMADATATEPTRKNIISADMVDVFV